MTASGWDEDDALLEELRAAVRQAGEPTPAMIAAGRAAITWATVDDELAVLQEADPSVDHALSVRGASDPPELVFKGRQLSVELEQDPDCLVGQLLPPTDGEVVLLSPGGELARTEADELGRFRFDRPVTGPVRLRCTTASGALLTDWMRL